MRRLAQTLLGTFVGWGFEDYLAYAHAWTLAEIEAGARVEGRTFFDHPQHAEDG